MLLDLLFIRGRLNGLAMLSINKNYSATPEEIVSELAKEKKRRFPFLLQIITHT